MSGEEKVEKIAICTPVYKGLTPAWVSSFFWGVSALQAIRPNAIIQFFYVEDTWISSAYMALCERAVRFGADWVVFIEEDIAIGKYALIHLFASHRDIVSGVYPTRTYPYGVCAWRKGAGDKWENIEYEREKHQEEVEADWVGLGFLRISRRVLAEVSEGWFGCVGQRASDFSFSMASQKAGYQKYLQMNARADHIVTRSLRVDLRMKYETQYRMRERCQGWIY